MRCSMANTDCPTEYQEQCKIIAWSRLMVATNQEPRLKLLRAGMEGLRLSMGVRVKAKKAGMDGAWPDLTLFIANKGFHALLIELKRLKGGTVSKEQAEMIGILQEQGYAACVCKGAAHAIKVIKEYLDIL